MDEGRGAIAFDGIPHDILPQKLFNFGIGGFLLNWCVDYLSDRQIVIRESSLMASTLPGLVLHKEFPRDLSWDLLFFAIFISDIPEVVCYGNTIALYADVTTLKTLYIAPLFDLT